MAARGGLRNGLGRKLELIREKDALVAKHKDSLGVKIQQLKELLVDLKTLSVMLF